MEVSHWGQEAADYLCMPSAGRSRPGSPDRFCSLIPPVHSQDHTGSGLHGPRCVTFQVFSHWWVPPVLGKYLEGEMQFMKGHIFLTYSMNKSGLWWFWFTVNGSCRLLSCAALQQVYFLLKVAKTLQVWRFMSWEKLLDLFQRALDFLSTWAVLE